MDSNVQTKVPQSRRTRYIIVGLVAVIFVLSFQLYRENKKKNEVIRRKAFLIHKLYDCRVASEKIDTKYKEKRSQNEQLMKDLTSSQSAHEEISKKFSEMQVSFQKRTEELQSLQKSADESKVQMSGLKDTYDNAMFSVKTMQDKLNSTITICNQHQVKSQSLNQTIAETRKELENCRKEKLILEQEKQESEEAVRSKIEEIRNIKRSMYAASSNEKGTSNLSHEQGENDAKSQTTPEDEKAKQTSNQPSKSADNPVVPTKSHQSESSMITSTKKQKESLEGEVTPNIEQPVAKTTVETVQKTTRSSEKDPSSEEKAEKKTKPQVSSTKSFSVEDMFG